MTDKMKKLSATARALLTSAAARNDHLVPLPKLPAAAARQVVRSLLNAGFAEEVPAPINDPPYAWRTGEDGGVLALQATALGIARALEGDEVSGTPAPVGRITGCSAEATEVQAGEAASTATPSAVDLGADAAWTGQADEGQGNPDRGMNAPAPTLSAEAPQVAKKRAGPAERTDGLRQAAHPLLEAWDNRGDMSDDDVQDIPGAVAALRVTLAASVAAPHRNDRASVRPETKQAQVIAMLRRHEGASGPQIAEAMGWAPHTVRGFLAGLPRKGIAVKILERVRQVGPNKVGAKGSFTVYRVVGTTQS
jgi:hypothetical protein